ncbi:MAG: hypothetical protein A4E64_02214 [Syntrophorhabdus sp. PtaU1.Bin058]|nr:MAG: hypothetical protein A4E64_02214 [Syntrophorhabdus sp. PtaU1.Bin058]
MDRIFEAIKRFMLQEVLLQRFEENVAEGKTATIDVFLKKGKEYIVRGKLAKGRGKPILSLLDVTGSVVKVRYGDGRNCLEVTPDRDGLYRIVITTDHAAEGHESVPVEVTFAYRLPPPQYIVDSVNDTLPCESDRSVLKEYESMEDLSETEATTQRGCKGN